MASIGAGTTSPSRDVRFQSGDITLAGTYLDVVDPSAVRSSCPVRGSSTGTPTAASSVEE